MELAQFNHFKDLPIEVVRVVVKFLPLESFICLRLTCKDLYYTNALRGIFPVVSGIQDAERAHFLHLLQKDLPGWTFCGCCLHLHPRRETPKFGHGCYEWKQCPRTKGIWLHFQHFGFSLQLEDIYQVLRRQRHGEPHGTPMTNIAAQTGWLPWASKDAAHSPPSLLKKLDIVPRIVGGCLILHASQRVLLRAQHRDSVRDLGDGHAVARLVRLAGLLGCRVTTCRHTASWPTTSGCPVVDAALELASTVSPATTPLDGPMQRCAKCIRQYACRVWDHDARGVEIAFDTWIAVGSWAAGDDEPALNVAAFDSFDQPPGVAKRCWPQAKPQSAVGYASDHVGALERSASAIDHVSLQPRPKLTCRQRCKKMWDAVCASRGHGRW